ncbi:uncharacterized protein [Physcomitrium patens]|uniref:Uncharacterized protein n=1 Tax=Physcomitrium patens TaxID=3218 RepID=A0A7I4E8Z5_PHYPA|nr:uncharacterized protein LOC112285130 isoform X3 [Physcomitrium patens]XP_024381458.1 uncharacterized protein LOC112285130 isoform X3 [Physcomitrium patens]|eukprot:XP_024381457.1 uncharacterized protein LOC112285130 isoform X3 [Physcomitrella patens]
MVFLVPAAKVYYLFRSCARAHLHSQQRSERSSFRVLLSAWIDDPGIALTVVQISFLDRIDSSFKISGQSKGLSVEGTDGCDLSANTSRKSVTELRSRSKGHVATAPCRQDGVNLPQGIIVATTDLQMRSLYPEDEKQVQNSMPNNLLAMAVGIKQKKVVNDIVQKFPLSNFTIMLFHYDGIVDQWQDLPWNNQSIHIVASHQTKWWYAKRFMHPDIVDRYNYIFLWDEDLGVEHFNAERYLEIMQAEGLEISQPGLDSQSSKIHHQITRRHPHMIAHKSILTNSCKPEKKAVPCTGYVEVMAPVFSKAAWKCVWYMIQNDLVHGWGVDFKLGYCAQGLRSEKVGVIDAEYILHKGIPSLSGASAKNAAQTAYDPRKEVRRKSSQEMLEFQKRWTEAARDDPTWKDPYEEYAAAEMRYANARASLGLT